MPEMSLTDRSENVGSEATQTHQLEALVETDNSTPTPDTIEKQPPPVTFPEGGWKAWLNVIGSMLLCFTTLGVVQAFGVCQDFYTRDYLKEFSPSAISWIGSTQLFLLYFLSPFSGALFDKGYFRPLLLFSSLLYLICHFLLSLAKPGKFYQVFLSQGLGIGLAMGCMFLPAIGIIAHYFQVRRSMVMGIAVAGSSVGGIVIPIMLNHLFNNPSIGFGWGIRYLGFILLGFIVLSNLIMRPRFPGRARLSAHETLRLLKVLFTDVPYMLSVVGFFFTYWSLFFPFFYLQLFAALHGINATLAFYSVAILNGASLVGRLAPGFVTNRLGALNIVSAVGVCSSCLMFVMFGAGTVRGLIVFAILYGFFSGAIISLTLSTIGTFSKSVNEIGLRTGLAMLCVSVSLLIGNPINGRLLDAPNYAWERPIILNGVLNFVGASLLFTSRMLVAKEKGTWRV